MNVSSSSYTNILIPLLRDETVWGLSRMTFVTLSGNSVMNNETFYFCFGVYYLAVINYNTYEYLYYFSIFLPCHDGTVLGVLCNMP